MEKRDEKFYPLELVCIKDTDNNIIFSSYPEDLDKNVGKYSLDDRTYDEREVDGRNYFVQSGVLYDEKNNKRGSIEVLTDISNQKRLERELTKAYLEMQSELDFASKIQDKLLPNKGMFRNIRVDYKYLPSKKLSGDLFDVYEIDKNHIGLYIVDVAGHGVAASMLTVFIRQTIYNIGKNTFQPSRVLKRLQESFKELGLTPDRYFTIFYAIYNLKDRTLKYANAGHNSIPIIYNDQTYIRLVNYGLPILGFDIETNYTDKSVTLNDGDHLFLYTDGLIEAKNTDGDEFGEDRVKEIILKSDGDLLDNLETAINEFSDIETNDDIAMMLLTVI